MKFTVTGADREIGEDVEFLVDAATQEEASAKANRRGILVSKCSASHRQAPVTGSTSRSHEQRSSPATPRSFARRLVTGALVMGAVIALIYFAYLKPQHAKSQPALDDAAKQANKTAEMVRQNNDAQLNDLRKRAAEHGVNLSSSPAERNVQDAERVAKRQKLHLYLVSARPVVQEVKALRSRVDSGANYNDFHSKFLLVADAYAQMEKPTADTLQFMNAVNEAVETYERIDRQWMLAIKNNLWIAEKQRIREMVQQADAHVDTMEARFAELEAESR